MGHDHGRGRSVPGTEGRACFSATPALRSARSTAALAFCGGEYRLSGVPRMHERPIGDLVDALRGIGARIDYAGTRGFPPLRGASRQDQQRASCG